MSQIHNDMTKLVPCQEEEVSIAVAFNVRVLQERAENAAGAC